MFNLYYPVKEQITLLWTEFLNHKHTFVDIIFHIQINNLVCWSDEFYSFTCRWFISSVLTEVWFLKFIVKALEVIQELQKHFPIKRCPLKIRVAAPEQEVNSLLDKLSAWKASHISKEVSASQLSVVSAHSFNFLL